MVWILTEMVIRLARIILRLTGMDSETNWENHEIDLAVGLGRNNLRLAEMTLRFAGIALRMVWRHAGMTLKLVYLVPHRPASEPS